MSFLGLEFSVHLPRKLAGTEAGRSSQLSCSRSRVNSSGGRLVADKRWQRCRHSGTATCAAQPQLNPDIADALLQAGLLSSRNSILSDIERIRKCKEVLGPLRASCSLIPGCLAGRDRRIWRQGYLEKVLRWPFLGDTSSKASCDR